MFRILLTCLLLQSAFIYAQYPYGRGRPHVVKDNVKCLYGLKNDSNQWVVQPQYTTLSDQRTYFLPGNSQSKFGLINNRGQLVLPVEYDKIISVSDHRFAPDLFIVAKNEKYGIADSSGKEIIPMIYDQVSQAYLSVYPHRHFILKKNEQYALIDNTLRYIIPFSDNKLTTEKYIPWKLHVIDKEGRHGLADSTGIIIPPVYKSITGVDERMMSFPDYFVAIDLVGGRQGLINSHGDTLLPFSQAVIGGAERGGKRIVVKNENESTFGLYDSSLHVIIPEGSKYIRSGYNQYIPAFPNDTCPVRRNEKWGLMSGNGDWVTKQIYDTILYPDFIADNSRGHFIVISDSKYGVIDPKGKTRIPLEYDMLVQCSDKHTVSGGSGCVRTINTYGTFFFVGKKNGFYGATKSDGSNFVPYVYDTIFTPFGQNQWYYRGNHGGQYANSDLYFTGKDKALFLRRGSDSNYYYSHSPSSTPYTLTYFFNVNKEIKVYRSGESYYPFREIKAGNKTILSPAREVNVSIDPNNYDQLQVRTGYYEDFLYFDRKTGKQVVNPLEGVQLVARAGENHIYQSKENTLGIISPEGQILLKPAYIGLSYVTTYEGKPYLWTKMSEDTSCDSYDPRNNCACGWRLSNLNGVPVSKYVFDLPQSLSQEMVPMVIDGKIGLFNVPKLKFVSAVVYKDISPFCGNRAYNPWNTSYCYNDTLFYVTRNNGQFGLMNARGKWVTDSTCDYLIPYPNRGYFYSAALNEFGYTRSLLVSSTSRVMVDDKGRIATDSLFIDSLMLQAHYFRSYKYQDFGYGRESEYLQRGPQIGYLYYSRRKDFRVSPQNDSHFVAALNAGRKLVLDLWGYRYQEHPGSYSIGGTAYVVNQMLGAQNSTGTLRTVSPKQSENLKADILYYSNKGISLQTNFNPDTSKAARNLPFPVYLNFQLNAKGEYIPATLDSLFCPTVEYQYVLNKLIREAIQKRDDMNIDCGSEDNFFLRTKDRYYFSDTALVFEFAAGFRPVVIPWTQLQPYSRPGGLVDRFIGNQNGEHCRPAYDTTAINYQSQGFSSMKQLQASGYLSREKITTYQYIFSDSVNHIVNGIRYCNGTDMVMDVFFEPVVIKNSTGKSSSYTEKAKLPKAIRKKKIVQFYSIKHYRCS